MALFDNDLFFTSIVDLNARLRRCEISARDLTGAAIE